MSATPGRVRIDKWLWAARFFKTRSLAAQAVDGGKVKLNGERAKPSKELKPGDELQILADELTWTINVVALSGRRGPAEAARRLYAENEASLARRQAAIEMRRLEAVAVRGEGGRPTKRNRRLIRRFTERD
jgi:ribosome-associated heat shock protein Hsp15